MSRLQYFAVFSGGHWSFQGQRYGRYRTQDEAKAAAREAARKSADQRQPT